MGKRKVLSEANLSEMLTPGPGQLYGTVKNLLGYDRVLVECADGVTRVCRIRGKMKRRVWIKMGDTVLVALGTSSQNAGKSCSGTLRDKLDPSEGQASSRSSSN